MSTQRACERPVADQERTDGEWGDARFWVYAIELSPEVLQHRKFRDANPDYQAAQPCYYVGMTGLTREERFANHKRGHKACRYVTRYGLHLMPPAFTNINPRTFEEAKRLERRIARRLRRLGYAVWQR